MIVFKNLENKLKELSIKFTSDLTSLLDGRGHRRTGALDASINFSFSRISEFKYNVHLDALEYINNLENGELIKTFMDQKRIELNNEIIEPIKKDFLATLISPTTGQVLKKDGTPDRRYTDTSNKWN